MENRVLSVFYGTDLLPYKDSERTVHYPITGSTFAGSNLTKTIKFYVDKIGGTSGISWVIVSKLPDGKIGYELLSNVGSDDEINEDYLTFSVSSYYTQVKGVVKLALRGYRGQVTFEEGTGGVYQISGDPLIDVTGTIDLAINYSPLGNTGNQILPSDVDRIIASLDGYLKVGNGIVVVSSISSVETSDFSNGQIFFDTSTNKYYRLSGGTLAEYSGFLTKTFIVRDDIHYGDTAPEELDDTGAIAYNPNTQTFLVEDGGVWDLLDGTGAINGLHQVISLGTLEDNINSQTTLKTIFNLVEEKPTVINVDDTWIFIKLIYLSSNYYTVFGFYMNHSYNNQLRYISGTYSQTTTLGTIVSDYNVIYANWEARRNYVPMFVADFGINRVEGRQYEIEDDSETKLSSQDIVYRLLDSHTDCAIKINNMLLFREEASVIDGESASFSTLVMSDDAFVYRYYIDLVYTGSYILNSQDYEFAQTAQFDDLQDQIDDLDDRVSNLGDVYNYKGTLTVAQINALNPSTLKVGDTYNLRDSGTLTLGNVEVVAGDNVSWTGDIWDRLSGTIDLSGYYDKEEIDDLLETKQVDLGLYIDNDGYIVQDTDD